MKRNLALAGAVVALAASACSSGALSTAPRSAENTAQGEQQQTAGMQRAWEQLFARTAPASNQRATKSIAGCPDSTQVPPGIWALGAAQPQFFVLLSTNASPVTINGPSVIDGVAGGPAGPAGPNGEEMAIGVASGGSLTLVSPAVINVPIRLATGVPLTSNVTTGPVIQPDDTNLQNAVNCAVAAQNFWNPSGTPVNFTNYNTAVEQGRLATVSGSTITAPDAFYDPNRTPNYIVDYLVVSSISGPLTLQAGSAVHALCTGPNPPVPCSAVLDIIVTTGGITLTNGGITTSDPYLKDYDVLLDVLNHGAVTITNSNSNVNGIILAPGSGLSLHDARITPEVIGGGGAAPNDITLTSGVTIFDTDNPLSSLGGTPNPTPTPKPRGKK